MARRKTLIFGRATEQWFAEALGYRSRNLVRKIPRESGLAPELDFNELEQVSQTTITDVARAKMDDEYKFFFDQTLQELISYQMRSHYLPLASSQPN